MIMAAGLACSRTHARVPLRVWRVIGMCCCMVCPMACDVPRCLSCRTLGTPRAGQTPRPPRRHTQPRARAARTRQQVHEQQHHRCQVQQVVNGAQHAAGQANVCAASATCVRRSAAADSIAGMAALVACGVLSSRVGVGRGGATNPAGRLTHLPMQHTRNTNAVRTQHTHAAHTQHTHSTHAATPPPAEHVAVAARHCVVNV
jgi:hypothetical protein